VAGKGGGTSVEVAADVDDVMDADDRSSELSDGRNTAAASRLSPPPTLPAGGSVLGGDDVSASWALPPPPPPPADASGADSEVGDVSVSLVSAA